MKKGVTLLDGLRYYIRQYKETLDAKINTHTFLIFPSRGTVYGIQHVHHTLVGRFS